MERIVTVALCAIILGAAAVIASQAASSTPLVRTNQTHMGRTALGWYKIAVQRRIDRDWLQHRLGQRVRELFRLQRRFKAAPTRPPHYAEWLCIHRGEGAWNDPNAPYYGGLQFAHSTWERNGGHKYAPEADQATPEQQMWIAENAWAESGGSFSQWPNTARACGLL